MLSSEIAWCEDNREVGGVIQIKERQQDGSKVWEEVELVEGQSQAQDELMGQFYIYYLYIHHLFTEGLLLWIQLVASWISDLPHLSGPLSFCPYCCPLLPLSKIPSGSTQISWMFSRLSFDLLAMLALFRMPVFMLRQLCQRLRHPCSLPLASTFPSQISIFILH